MKALKFKHQNTMFAENQPEYNSLPALKFEDDKDGNVIFCMGLSFQERIRVLFLGKIWVNLLTFNKRLTPSFLTTKRKDVFSIPFDEISLKSKVQLCFDLGIIIYLDI